MLQLLLLSASQGDSNGCQSLLFIVWKWLLIKYTCWKRHFSLKYMKIFFPVFYGQTVILEAKNAFFLHSLAKGNINTSFGDSSPLCFAFKPMSLHVRQDVCACLLWCVCLQLLPDCFQTQQFYGLSYRLKVTSLFVFYFDTSDEMKFLNYKDIQAAMNCAEQ